MSQFELNTRVTCLWRRGLFLDGEGGKRGSQSIYERSTKTIFFSPGIMHDERLYT